MKNALILHGRNCSPEMFWYPYLKNELEKIGYQTSVPLLPQNTSGDRKVWVPFIQKTFKFNSQSIAVAVSASVPVLFEVVESLDVKIDKLITVAGFISPLNGAEDHPAINKDYNWRKIRQNIKDLYIINSDTDKTGADKSKGEEIFAKLGGTQIVMHNQGHFGSIKYNQPYKTFPLLQKLIQKS